MDIVNKAVNHATFGEGTVLSQNETVIAVGFPDMEEKLFEYPEAFVSHLSLHEPALHAAVCTEARRKLQREKREKLRIRMQQEKLLSEQEAAAKPKKK